VDACTIVARNYFPAARLLARSFLDNHPGSSFTVLLLDGSEQDESGEGFDVLSPYEIGIERAEVHTMAMIYDVKEFATAVKPWLLKTLLSRGSADSVVYFDPDIEIFASLDDIDDLAREHSIVLTPHMMTPLPMDGLLPDDLMILQAGTFNLGFIAVGQGAGEFLDWWSAKLARDCLVAIDRGQFVDQRWVDFVPVLFDHTVLRDPAYNVAYWNLHERRLRWTGEQYEVAESPLRFFHFSGFDPTKPDVLSTHLGAWARIRLSDHPDLARICSEYARRVIDLGYIQHKDLPYRFDSLEHEIPVDPRMRKIYREALKAYERGRGDGPPDPFDPALAGSFLEWLREPTGPGGLSRYLFALYCDRIDMQAAFPLVRNIHRRGFLHWAATAGRHQEKIPRELVPAIDLTPSARLLATMTRARWKVERRMYSAAARYPALGRAKPVYFVIRRTMLWLRGGFREELAGPHGELGLEVVAAPASGINVVGYLRAELGIGELARKLIMAIDHGGIPFSTITYQKTVSRQEFPLQERNAQSAPYDTNLVCVNADQLPEFAQAAGSAFFSNRYTIGVWFWEVETFPKQFHGAFELVNEVWVGSEFVRHSLASVTAKPVKVVPLPLEAPAAEPIQRASLGLPESFLFFFTFDFMSIAERKNPLGLIAAFIKAFTPGEGPALVIKSITGQRSSANLERLRLAAAEHPDIYVIDGYLAPDVKDGLMAACDCYVSLHRSEGLGLTMSEAMSYGKPVIATGYSGNLTFMDDRNSYLVPYTLATVPPGCEPYPAGALWAEPDLDQAASLMRHVYEKPDEARQRGQRARQDIVTHHSPESTAEFIANRLDEVHGGREWHRSERQIVLTEFSSTRPGH
jgi:glycosyltransferase involved in cell wall biosynthesis